MRPLKISSEEAIVQAALQTLAQNPGASLSQIALRAGVGRATLHRHFPTRDDLLHALALRALDETDAATAALRAKGRGRGRAGTEAEIRNLFTALIPLGDRYHFLRSESAPAGDLELTRRYARQIKGLSTWVDNLRTRGVFASDVPDAWIVAMLDSLIWVAWSEVHRGGVTAEQAAGLATRSVLRGLGRPASRR